MAQTLDGRIARSSDHFPDWTGKEDKKLFVKLTKEAGVLIMGSKTYDTIGKPLPGRLNVILTRDRDRIKNEKLKIKKEEKEGLLFTDQSPREILKNLEAENYDQVVLAGGAQINTLFLQENLIDEIHVTISPIIFGSGLGLFTDEIACELQLRSCEKLGEDLIYAQYLVKKK